MMRDVGPAWSNDVIANAAQLYIVGMGTKRQKGKKVGKQKHRHTFQPNNL